MTWPLETLAHHVGQQLLAPLPGPDAQRRFAPLPLIEGWTPDLAPVTARPAAALLLLYPGPDGASIPLTVRPLTLARHGGQISLPGGAIDTGESIEVAALREADEEIGVVPAAVTLLGRLSPLWIPVSHFLLSTVVGVARQPPAFRLHEREVQALVELPVTHLLDRTAIRWRQRQRGSTRIDYPCFTVGDHAIWGATAMVLSEFSCLIDPDHAPPPR